MEQQFLPISKLKANTGQIPGLPKNPRVIRDDRFQKLLQSIKDDPEMLSLRELIVYPYEGNYVVIAGNMRLRAIQELGYKECPVKVLFEDTPVEKLKAYTIKDNVPYGDNDWSVLSDEWDTEQLSEWGLEEQNLLDDDTHQNYFETEDLDEVNSDPKASDDNYSVFELVMLHENKLLLIETLSKVKNNFLFEKNEDALMEILRIYNKDLK
jgi:hypothetical protein